MSGCARTSLAINADVCFASRSSADCSGGPEANFQGVRLRWDADDADDANRADDADDAPARNTVQNLEAEIVNFDKLTVRALREPDYVRHEAAAQHEEAAAAAEEARLSYASNIKQVQAAANVKDKALLTRLQEARDALNDTVTGLEAHITELQRMLSRANAAARAANNKDNAAAVPELERKCSA
eukprot:2063476-Pleurochrysis_carterae.AAC.1